MLEKLLGRAAGDEDLFRRKREKAKLRKGLDARKAEALRDPRAQSVTAALFSSAWLADAVVERLRDNIRVIDERGTEKYLPKETFTRTRLVEPHDLALLALCAFAIEDGTGSLGADPDCGLRELPDVTGSLRRLHLAKLITATDEGNYTWHVAWGERALKIARAAGVRVPEPEKAQAASAKL